MTPGLCYNLIKKATSGDERAINEIIKIYGPYINSLASHELYDLAGNEYIGIDVDLRDSLRSKLINTIMKYEIK